MQGKQAKIVSPTQERAILGYLETTRYPARDRVMVLLSMKAGLRAKEMASLTWAMVTLQTPRGDLATPERPILFSERGGGQGDRTILITNGVSLLQTNNIYRATKTISI